MPLRHTQKTPNLTKSLKLKFGSEILFSYQRQSNIRQGAQTAAVLTYFSRTPKREKGNLLSFNPSMISESFQTGFLSNITDIALLLLRYLIKIAKCSDMKEHLQPSHTGGLILLLFSSPESSRGYFCAALSFHNMP